MSHQERFEIDGVPFPVWLGYSKPWRDQSSVTWGRGAPDDLEQHRVQRIARALDTKLDKLNAAALQHQAHSMLVLEDRDLSLASPGSIQDAVFECRDGLRVFPDVIMLVLAVPPPPLGVELFHGDDPVPITADSFREMTLPDGCGVKRP